ncbi:hypothetical protein MED121_16799 [Marinomonas sp. MED121]|uniref:type I-F CRISPR-associated helicase Cas3f n=1 Tax=Marinomonas sp. MED121 TaxID=314277 RepID=UPI0000690FA9|nr:type I-F CRISPR-associated helicase Cas3f [Marinomonas sp. MED121]EAQ67605.1 hypothetical protein MED121_16799 [Marinomonas sp. MED121]
MNRVSDNSWKYLPVIKSLTAMAALLHDWGKASLLFQQKLDPEIKTKFKGDPIRHEWISCILFKVFVTNSAKEGSDEEWLSTLISDGIKDADFQQKGLENIDKPLVALPTAASLIAWLIVSHHRLPLPRDRHLCDQQRDKKNASLSDLLNRMTQAWGYENPSEIYNVLLPKCFKFPEGLLSESEQWITQLKLQAEALRRQLPLVAEIMKNGSWRVVLHHARLSLMLGDHYYSSQDKDKNWQSSIDLYANTNRETKALKQKLDEHLVNVAQTATTTASLLPYFESNPLKVKGLAALSVQSDTPRSFRWQDNAVMSLVNWRARTKDKSQGYFVVNMASTGSGKTIANAKIMQAVSEDQQSLRFILALGLRTLTLQTGDEYRNRLNLEKSDLAVLIGSKAVFELHKSGNNLDKDEGCFEGANQGSESLESLQDESDVLHWQGVLPEDKLSTVLTKEKDRKLLHAPVLACTIDHIMAATETKRGGRYILPCLRLMSSDLVIDEIDDFSGDDLIAIGRLVHLAGMLGRKVMISSATISPDLALGFYNAYQQGWNVFAASREQSSKINCVYVDEFNTQCELVESGSKEIVQFQTFQHHFIEKRVNELKQQTPKRKADIIPCNRVEGADLGEQYFEHVKQAILIKHSQHSTIDNQSQIRVSFGVVRIANIRPCMELTQHLLGCEWPDEIEIRCMAYHSQQVLLLRHEQEKHLDQVLKRKEKAGETPAAFSDPIIRQHLSSCHSNNIIFILVATPVEEVGRDHDFDWAIIEPSSYRSIIQMAGRVRRHREGPIEQANVGLLQYNYRGYQDKEERVFNRPGYETDRATQLISHDIKQLLDEKSLLHSLDAVPRIQKHQNLDPNSSLADLEHFATARTLGIADINKEQSLIKQKQGRFNRRVRAGESQSFWSNHLQGHLVGYWWLTALPQYFKRFRKSEPSVQLYLIKKEGVTAFHQRDDHGGYNPIELIFNIKHHPMDDRQESRLWLRREYSALVSQYSQSEEGEFITSLKFGEINFTDRGEQGEYSYNDQFGLVRTR